MRSSRLRLAIIVSHPIQYYVPLYKRLARRDDLIVKVFFTSVNWRPQKVGPTSVSSVLPPDVARGYHDLPSEKVRQ